MKKYKKNPYLYKYGYHFTEYDNLNSILRSGLKIRKNKYESFYHFISPLYFITSLTNFVINQFPYLYSRTFVLKVNIENFDQNIDINSLLFGMNFAYDENFSFIYSKKNTPNKLKYWIKYFNNKIPVFELQTNRKLIIDIITTTHSFTVNQNVPFDLIEEIYETKINYYTREISYTKISK